MKNSNSQPGSPLTATVPTTHTLYIKNMVCNRCIFVVRQQLESITLRPLSVELGIVRLAQPVDDTIRHAVRQVLEPFGFELMDDPKAQLIEQVKTCIIELVHHRNALLKTNLSDYLTDKLHKEYDSLSKLFSETTGTTIEKYLIAQKIERAKELLVYGELSLNEIADLLNYSSTAYLSTQFKSVTGLTPSHFRKIKENKRKPLDKIGERGRDGQD